MLNCLRTYNFMKSSSILTFLKQLICKKVECAQEMFSSLLDILQDKSTAIMTPLSMINNNRGQVNMP